MTGGKGTAVLRIRIVAVGRWKRGPEQELFEQYRKRLSWPLELVEVEEKRPLPVAQRMESEEALIRAKLPSGAVAVALDERGDDLTSRKLAQLLKGIEDSGTSDLCFLIGGADGLTEPMRADCRHAIRFGRVTWPHMMVRPMLAEQLYRCRQIIDGHPYHRD